MTDNLTNHLLVAMPTLADPNFSRTVTLICEHGKSGAMGIVINQPTTLTLGELFAQLSIENAHEQTAKLPVFAGGPVQIDRGFILHDSTQRWESTLNIGAELNLTFSSDILTDISKGNGPTHVLVALGYAGWGPGQLENEISQNSWLTVPYEHSIVFQSPPEQRWHSAARKLGIDLNLISGEAGHA